jgi:hypothetical protein
METPMANPPHPGLIVYVDGATQEEISRVSATEVPETMRFAPTTHGLVPVVKVVTFLDGDKRYVREYGPGDEFLRATMMVRA